MTQRNGRILIYGATGYTGRLVAALAKARGVDVELAGRNAGSVAAMAAELGLPWRAFDLAEAAAHLQGIGVVLHCAGPFVFTSKPMVRACLEAGVHYLDITGEIGVFEAAARVDAKAVAAGITVMPGVGFDVVPSDCLAAYVAAALPGATRLHLAFRSLGAVSHGTASTALTSLGEGSAMRRDGEIVRVPLAHSVREVDFGTGPLRVASIPWGDVSTAFHSTGIGTIVTHIALPPRLILMARASNHLGPILRSRWVRGWLQRRLDAAPAGPSESTRDRGRSFLWAEACHPDGRVATATLQCPEGYNLTADAALRIAVRVAAGEAPVGFQTPSRAFGADLILDCDGVSRSAVSIRPGDAASARKTR